MKNILFVISFLLFGLYISHGTISRIYDLHYNNEIPDIDSLDLFVNRLEDSVALKRLRIEELDHDPMSAFLKVRDSFNYRSIRLINSGPGLDPGSGYNSGSIDNYCLSFSGDYKETISMIFALENNPRIGDLQNAEIKKASGYLITKLEFNEK